MFESTVFSESEGRVLFRYNEGFNLSDKESLNQQILPSVSQEVSLDPYQWHVIHLPYSDLDQVRHLILYFFPDMKVNFDLNLKKMFLYGLQNDLDHVMALLTHFFDDPKLFEVLLIAIEINEDEYDNYETFFSSFLSGFQVDFSGDFSNPFSFLSNDDTWSYLVKTGKAKLIAQPLIVVQNNYEGHLTIGNKLPYSSSQSSSLGISQQIHYLDTGIDISVKPSLVSSNRVMATIELNVSSLKQWKSIGDSVVPELSTRQIQTQLFLDLNVVGLVASMENERFMQNTQEPPFFSKIPLLGPLFVSDSQERVSSVILFFSIFRLIEN